MVLVYPKIDDLLKKVDNKYTLTITAAKRARQINEYLNAIRRQELTRVRPPQIEAITNKPLSVALREIAEGKISYERAVNGIK
ncbi:MAG: DNA-directed RNA polymerase subunit omega [Actinomycetota bacterium]|nr:DNA-directed RNA polymerase subunit omega [Actinomycetota bacterium]MDI6821997.1 DNA-directed RNA polymerase subunit omega [Actinomycetota bacterium]